MPSAKDAPSSDLLTVICKRRRHESQSGHPLNQHIFGCWLFGSQSSLTCWVVESVDFYHEDAHLLAFDSHYILSRHLLD